MRDLNTGIVTPAPVIVDEQAKAAAMRAATSAANKPTPVSVSRVNTTTLAGIEAASGPVVATPDVVVKNPTITWTKAGTINTANGPVDVDASGVAADGSTPVAKVIKTEENIPAGFNAGPFPKELEQYFGSGSQFSAWRIVTNNDGSQQLEVVTGPNSTQTFGYKFKPNGSGGFTKFDSSSGGGSSTVLAGSTGLTTEGGPSIAINTFKNTLALFFGQGEMSQPWVNELYKLVNPYYKTGSSIDEAFNMAIQEGRNNPNLKAFTDRFAGIYALQDKLIAGQAVKVPTIAEFTAAEAGMGSVLRQAGLGDIATQQYLGTIIGKGLSVSDVGNYINNIYNEIQNLPQDIKDSVMLHYPGLDNVSLAKSILTGDKGFAQLQKELTAQEIQGVSAKQGLGTYNPITGKYSGISDAQSFDLTGQGFNMATAQPGLARAALIAPTVESLSNITAGATPMTQADIVNATVGGLASQQRKIDLLAQAEANRFQASSGNAPGAFSTGYLKRTSVAGQI